MNISKMIEKMEAKRQEQEAVLMAMPKKQFEALQAEWNRNAARKNADAMWIIAKARGERIAFLRNGGTLEEYRVIVKARIAARKKA
jgi:hypothetical protein